jgi:hypothetical protein
MAFQGSLDTKSIAKFPNFHGEPSLWSQWSLKFEAWAALLADIGTMVATKAMDRAVRAACDRRLDQTSFGQEVDAVVKSIYGITPCCRCAVAGLLRLCARRRVATGFLLGGG